MLRALRLAASAVMCAALGTAVVLALVTSVPGLAGLRSFNVLSGSMEPSLRTGGVVLDETIRPLEARPGDIVTFNDPSNRSRLLTHRVRDVTVRDGRAHFTTRGDANDVAERWEVPLGEEIGRVAYHMPYLGYPRQWLAGRAGRLAALALVAVWALLALRSIWSTPRARSEADAKELEVATP
jgi:signal peptidase